MTNPSPLRYPGGKIKTYNYIKSLIDINNCTTYIEPFAGGSAVALQLLLNNDVKRIIINDFDKSIYAFWKSVLYETDNLIKMIEECEITMVEWEKQKTIQEHKEEMDTLDLGFSTFFLNRVNRSGIIKGGVIGGKSQSGKYKMDCRFNKKKLIEKIEIIAMNKEKIKIFNQDATVFIDNVIKKTRNSFTFFDPPYFKKGPSLYTSFYKFEDHLELSQKIKFSLKNRKWIVTYDTSPEILEMYSGLPYIKYYLTYTAQNKKRGLEYMFYSNKTNPGKPNKLLSLHQDEYINHTKSTL